MKYTIKHVFYALTVAILLAGCEAEFDNPVGDTGSYSSGTADFSNFVALGDSLTAGYADGALYRTGQENSYGAILAQQFALVGGGAFAQPLMPVEATGSLTAGGTPVPDIGDRYFLFPTGDPEDPLTPAPLNLAAPSLVVSTEVLTASAGPYNNMGVPGAKSFHAGAEGYGTKSDAGILAGLVNPYFARFSSDFPTATTATMILDAAGQSPSFFVMWLGNNDILSYATGGGTGVDRNALDDTDMPNYGSEDITDDLAFAGTYSGLLSVMTTMNPSAKGVLVNIPNVSSIPYFTTVPYNAIPMTADEATEANIGFAAYNDGVNGLIGVAGLTAEEAARRQIVFVEGLNPVVILDEDLTDLTGIAPPATDGLINMRQATINDFIVLPTASKLGEDAGGGFLWGISAPLLDEDVLKESEVAAVETARQAYNTTIAGLAAVDDNLLLYDAAAMLDELNTSGIFYGTGGITSTYATGGGFSLDGVHPTARGYAVIANDIIEVINNGFGANIPPVDPNAYTTVFVQ